MDYCLSKYPSVIPPYGGLKLYDSPEYKADSLLFSYVTKKDISEINKILDTGKYKPSRDVIDVLFTDKVNASKFSILQFISQIRQRKNIKKGNLGTLDYDMDRFKTQLVQVEDLWLYNEIFDLDNRKTKISLTQKIAGLKKEKRAEEVSCWRDLAQMRKELTDLIKEYRATSRKKELVASPQFYSLEAKIGNDEYS